MKHKKLSMSSGLCFFFPLFLALAPGAALAGTPPVPGPKPAAPPTLSMPAPKKDAAAKVWRYDVYTSGLHVVEAELSLDLSRKNRYEVFLASHTRGFLGKIVPWSGSFETKGWRLSGDRFRPELHRSVATWKQEKEVKEYRYSRGGNFLGYRVEIDGKKPKEKLDRELADDTTDLLSATLAAMQSVSDGESCAGTSEIFDGDRRYGIEFRSKGTERLESSTYASFSGEAEKCEVEVFPAGGRWHARPRGWMSIQEQGRLHGSLPTVWFAQVEEGAPAIPVRIRVKTEFGTLFMHLSEARSGGG